MSDAMQRALEWSSAIARAERIARETTNDDARRWAERNLIQLLLLYAWATRERRDLIPFYRDRAELAIAAYRELRRQERIEREEAA